MKTKAIAVAMLAAVLAMSFALVVTPDSDAYNENDVVAIGETGYTSLSEAITAAENGVTIKLINDVNVKATIAFAEKVLTLDLNGFNLTGDLSEASGSNAIISINDTTLTIVDSSEGKTGKIVSNEYGVYAIYNGKGIIDSITIESGDACVSGNNTTGNMNFDIMGSTLTSSNGEAIYMPSQGILNITEGSVLNGGISARMGQIHIDDSTVKGMSDNQSADSFDEYWGYSGSAWIGDAVYIWGGTYSSEDATYGNTANVTITGDSIIDGNAHNALAVYNIANKYDQEVTFTIEDGVTITGNIVIDSSHLSETPKNVVIDMDAVSKIVRDDVVYLFITMADCVKDAGADETIILLANVDCVAGLNEKNIDTNNFTVNHSYNAGETTKQPTFTSKGTFTRTCTVCEHTIDSEIQMVTLSDLITAFGSIDGYTPVGEATVTSANVLSMRYSGSYTGTDVMNDLARFLGVLHDTGSVQALSYGTDGYTWNETLGNQGSNWAKGETSLISVLVKDFRNGVITNKVALKLDNGTSFEICFDARFVAVVGDITSNGTVTYSVFQDAVSQGGTVTLLSDVTDTAAITIDRNVTILGNNKAFAGTFILSESKDSTPYDVTIADLVMEGAGACAVSSDVKGVSLILSKVSVKGYTASVDVSDAVSVSVTGSSFDGAVKVTSEDAFDFTMDSLKFSIPAGKAFVMDGTTMTVSEASIEGIVKDTVDVIVTSKATIPAGKTVEGTIWFDTTKDNGITLSSVKAGTSGVTLTKGSVEIIGDFISSEDGTITVTGIARIVGDSTIDGIELVVPKGASLTVEEGASVTGTGSISNAGTVKVLGDLATALDNTADSVVQVALTGSIDTDKVTGEGKVSFDSIILRDIGTKYYRVGDKVDIPVTVNPSTAELRIDKSVSPSWLTIVDGHIVGTVSQDGSFNVTVVASMDDRESVSESFVLNAVVGVDPDQSHEPQISSKEIVKIAVIILVVLMVICLVTRAFIG